MIERQEVIRIAALARLDLSKEEIEQYQQDLTRFLVSCAKLKEVDVSEFEGSSHAVQLRVVLRRDQVGVSLEQQAILEAGPEVFEGFFRVPRIVEGSE